MPSGLKYDLVGRTHAVMASPQPYSIRNRFPIAATIVRKAVVATASDPWARLGVINFTGFVPPASDVDSGSEFIVEDPKFPQSLMLSDENIHRFNGRTFKITNSA